MSISALVYMTITFTRSTTVGEQLQCATEVGNAIYAKDRCIISSLQGSDAVANLPQKISRINTSSG